MTCKCNVTITMLALIDNYAQLKSIQKIVITSYSVL